MNSREKGKRGERQWRDELRANGYAAMRGQQFSGSPNSPDVICGALPWAHFEVKLAERLDIYAAMDQARRDCGGRAAFVAHRRNYWPWLVSMEAERFYRLLNVDLTGQWAERMASGSPGAVFAGLPWAFGEVREGRRLNIHEAMWECGWRNAERGARKVPIVAHRRPGSPWLVTVKADTFFRLLRGEFAREGREGGEGDFTEGNQGNEGRNNLGTARSESDALPEFSREGREGCEGDFTGGNAGNKDGRDGTNSQSPIADRRRGVRRFQNFGFQKRCAQESRP